MRAAAISFATAISVLALLSPAASSNPSTALGRHTHAVPTASLGPAGLIDQAFCKLVGNKGVQAGGVALLGYFLKRKISSSNIYMTAALTSVSVLCEPVMKRAVPALARFLGLAPRPTRAATRSQYRSNFGQATAASVSAKLQSIGWNYSPAAVGRITRDLCLVVRRGESSRPTLRYWFVNGKLDSLPALNGLVAHAGTCRPALTPDQLGYLTSSITSYLTDNTYPRDYTPPVTLLYTPTETLLSNGLVQVSIKWSSFDFGGRVAEQALFIGTNSRWYGLSSGTATVARGQQYNLATRARDAAGNWSPWVFTPVYQARTR